MWDHIINIHPSELLNTKTKESKINESLKKKKTIYILYLIISLQIFFKKLTKYKNDYQ